MKNLPIKLQEMINKSRPDLKEKAAGIVQTDENYYIQKYSLLADLLGDKYTEISKETAIKMYYGEENVSFLTAVDYVIANLIFSLQNGRAENVFLNYEKEIKLGSDEPEYDYLVNLIAEELEK